MVIDYKGVSFSFDQRKRKKRLRLLRLMGAVVVIILAYLVIANARDRGKIKHIQTLLLENKTAEASDLLKEIMPSLFHQNSKKELNALVYLYANEYSKAKELLETITGKSTVIDSREFLDYFSERAEYRKLGVYTDFLDKKPDRREQQEVLGFYQIQAKTGQLDWRQSRELIDQLSAEFKKKEEKALTLTDKINRQIQSGKVNYIFDINGKPLACYDIREKKTVSLVPGIHFAAFPPVGGEGIKFYRLTLDSGIQELIHRLFRNLHGTFLLMNVNDSGIAAAYSKPVDPDKSSIDTVFSETYEPGSIIKVLTLFAYLKAKQTPQQTGQTSSSSPAELFPLQCEGLWKISENGGTGNSRDRIFRDWTIHHRVADGEEALAVSCNIAFAKMGVQTGLPALSDVFDRFYFNAAASGLTLTDSFLTFATGNYNKGISTRYQLANLAVGLNEISVTTFHSALIAAIISQNGSIYAPHLITNKKNLLNIAFYNHPPRLIDVFKGSTVSTVFLKLKSAMRLAVEHPEGTGKRARVDVVAVALKTGTAGDRKLGLDAILMGYFPADKPEYAFAFRLERAGKAEWQGALFLNQFLTAFYQRKRP